jgi:hypothetical protein
MCPLPLWVAPGKSRRTRGGLITNLDKKKEEENQKDPEAVHTG